MCVYIEGSRNLVKGRLWEFFIVVANREVEVQLMFIWLRWWYTLCYYSFRPSTFKDIHNILVAHVVYTRPQNVVTKSSGFAYTIIAKSITY